jgi:hypothetical protein
VSGPVGASTPPGQEIHSLAKGSTISMSKITTLASGQINRTDSITVILIRPDGMPPSVIIHWPQQATVSVPIRFAEVASAAVKILARSSTELSRIIGKQRRPR